MNRLLGILALGMVILALACRREQRRARVDSGAHAGRLGVALLMPGPINDASWNQSAYEALRAVEKQLDVKVAWSASVPQTHEAHVRELRRYAGEGFDLIVGNGTGFVPAAEQVAREYPAVRFAVIGAYAGNNRNLGALNFNEGDLGYLSGVVAGLKTKSRTIGHLGGLAYPQMWAHANAFTRGAHSVDPRIDVRIAWTGSWSDAEAARRVARELIASKADVLAVHLDQPAATAIAEAQAAHILAIGGTRDMHAIAPDTVITSGIRRHDVLLKAAVELVRSDRWEGKLYTFGLLEGAVELAPFRGHLTAAEIARVEAVRADLIAGRIEALPAGSPLPLEPPPAPGDAHGSAP